MLGLDTYARKGLFAALLETIRSGKLGSGTLSVEVSLYGGGSSPRASPANQDIPVKNKGCKPVKQLTATREAYHVKNKFPPRM